MAKTTSMVCRVEAASGPSAATYRRASSGTANGQRMRPSTWTIAAADPITAAGTVRAGAAPTTTARSANHRQHRYRAHEKELPANQEGGAASIEAAEDHVWRLAQDVRVVERPAELDKLNAIGTTMRRIAAASSAVIPAP